MAQQLCGFGSITVRFGSKTDIVGEVVEGLKDGK